MGQRKVSLIIAGCGSRGSGYAKFAKNFPGQAEIVGVAEPREDYRRAMEREYSVPEENVFKTWEDMAERGKFADAVIIATQDSMHMDPAIAFAAKGYDILLEKPMSSDEANCRRIVEAAREADIILCVCHVLRYTAYTKALKQIIDSGEIGDIVCIEHCEPVGYWHQAHSYVRGNWRSERESSPMLLAKSCHDLDWLRHITGKKFKAVSSFGSLKHFRKEERPAGAAERCCDCGIEEQCPYSAKKIYIRDRLIKGSVDWPVNVLTTDITEKGITDAIRTGPYGRCVYACDNDVVDNQVVIMEFEGGCRASFTMTAFAHGRRRTSVYGTKGELKGDSSKIIHYDFLTEAENIIDTKAPDSSILGGHGGGDGGLMEAFVGAVAEGDESKILSGPEESLESHLAVFAAEEARKKGIVVRL